MRHRLGYSMRWAGFTLLLAACVTSTVDDETKPREAWRDAAEQACLARNKNMASAYVTQGVKIVTHGACGMQVPLQISAFAGGSIRVGPTATLGCPIAEATDGWLKELVQPAASALLGSPVVQIKQLSNYACRRPMGYRPGKLSEHAYGNALDVAEFKLANGRVVTVQQGWTGAKDEQAFLREIVVTACERFKTVLGPGVAFHHNHFHVDLARRGASGVDRYCRPLPDVVVPKERAGNLQVAGRLMTRGEVLKNMPPDVEVELADPFGVEQTKTGTGAKQ